MAEQRKKYRKKIAEGKKEAKKKIAAEKKKYQSKINAGWSRYYSEKAKYESKLEEAKLLLEENREEAEKKTPGSQGRSREDGALQMDTLDRRANAGYVDSRSNLTAIRSAGNVFGILFMIVTAIVCLSTLVIIIEEQKKLVGTSKAFGFFRTEVLGKYLMFGIAAALVGSLLASGGACILSTIVQKKYAEAAMYQAGAGSTIFTPGITAACGASHTAGNYSCNGCGLHGYTQEPRIRTDEGRHGRQRQKEDEKESGGIDKRFALLKTHHTKYVRGQGESYSHRCHNRIQLHAHRNGISMKFAYDGMTDKQISDVNKYDFK